jgi:hypothetical protein
MKLDRAISIHEVPNRRRAGVPTSPAIEESLSQLRMRLTEQGASAATVKIYHGWTRRFLTSAATRVREPSAAIDHFVRWMQTAECSVASQRQALAALGYYFREVLGSDVSATLGPHRPAMPGSRRKMQSTRHSSSTSELTRAIDLVRLLMESTGRPATDILDLRIGDIVLDGNSVGVRVGTSAEGSSQPLPIPAELGEALIDQVGESWRVHQLDFLQWLESQAGRESVPRRMPNEIFKLRTLFPSTSAPGELDPLKGRGALCRSQLGFSVRRPREHRPRLAGRAPQSSRTMSDSNAMAIAVGAV